MSRTTGLRLTGMCRDRAACVEAGFSALPSLRGTALKGPYAGQEDGKKRVSEVSRPIHHELHVSR